MIVKFLVDVDDGKSHSVVLACQPQWTILRAVTALRRRIALPVDAHVSVRYADGSPVPTDKVMRTLCARKPSGCVATTTLHAIVDVASHLVASLRLRRRMTSDVDDSDDDDDAYGNGAAEVDDGHIALVAGSAKVTTLGGEPRRRRHPDVSSSSHDDGTATDDILSYSSDLSEETERLVQGIGIHTIKVNQSYRKAYATRTSETADVVVREQPMQCVAYPQQLVETVRSHEKLRCLSYNHAFHAVSSIPGLDDAAFSRYLSIAMTYGLTVAATRSRSDALMALYPDITGCRHSCYPNSVFVRVSDRAPFEGALRCATKNAIEAGDEVTYLYPHVDRREFALLPRDRRERWLRRQHYIQPEEFCGCARCWKADRDEKEVSITGAFFDEAVERDVREQAASAMRASFAELLLTDESRDGKLVELEDVLQRAVSDALQTTSSSPPPLVGGTMGAVPSASAKPSVAETLSAQYRWMCSHATVLLDFISNYTRRPAVAGPPGGASNRSLKLHVCHWRLSLARLRLLDVFAWLLDNKVDAKRAHAAIRRTPSLHVGHDGSSAAMVRDELPSIPFCKAAFDGALDQINVEAILLPSAHPLLLTSCRIWRRMMAHIPQKLAAGVQLRSLSPQWCPDVHWDTLAALERWYPSSK